MTAMAANSARALVASLLLAACSTPPEEIEDVSVTTGEEALTLLMEGNDRFVSGHLHHDHQSQARRARLSGGQHPFGIVLGCADSRVSPEIIFDVGLGDLFVIRVAGNVVGEDEAGSIQYSIAHLHTPVVIVLGHEGCGAVTAAIEAVHDEDLHELEHLLSVVAPAVRGIDPDLPLKERVHLGVEANVHQSVGKLLAIQERLDLPRPRSIIVGAVYDLETGRVRLLDSRLN
jgi:carbonic anhydrase